MRGFQRQGPWLSLALVATTITVEPPSPQPNHPRALEARDASTDDVAALARVSRWRTQLADDRDLYTALLQNILHVPVVTAAVVDASPMALTPLSDTDWRMLGSLGPQLRAKVDRRRPGPPVPFTTASFPPGTRVIAAEDIESVLTARPPAGGWFAFQERFKIHSFQAFSRAVVSDDGLDALVRYSHTCGNQCGETGFALLHRNSTRDRWLVTRRLPKIMS